MTKTIHKKQLTEIDNTTKSKAYFRQQHDFLLQPLVKDTVATGPHVQRFCVLSLFMMTTNHLKKSSGILLWEWAYSPTSSQTIVIHLHKSATMDKQWVKQTPQITSRFKRKLKKEDQDPNLLKF